MLTYLCLLYYILDSPLFNLFIMSLDNIRGEGIPEVDGEKKQELIDAIDAAGFTVENVILAMRENPEGFQKILDELLYDPLKQAQDVLNFVRSGIEADPESESLLCDFEAIDLLKLSKNEDVPLHVLFGDEVEIGPEVGLPMHFTKDSQFAILSAMDELKLIYRGTSNVDVQDVYSVEALKRGIAKLYKEGQPLPEIETTWTLQDLKRFAENQMLLVFGSDAARLVGSQSRAMIIVRDNGNMKTHMPEVELHSENDQLRVYLNEISGESWGRYMY